MNYHILTLFPEMIRDGFETSITGRAVEKGLLSLETVNIRDFSVNKHNRVDDTPYGGGMGMLLMAEPIADCFEHVCELAGRRPHLIYMSPQGKTLTQQRARELAGYDSLAILCGHYEGVDERVLEEYVDEEISIGDYVLTGGELPALVLADAVSRMVPGVLSSDECFEEESHFSGLLEYPHYTKPAVWRGKPVPEVLLSGHHGNIEKWRRQQALLRTAKKRPEMLEKTVFTKEEQALLEKALRNQE